MHDTYVTATLELLAAGTSIDTVISGLKDTLKRRGHERLLPRILAGVARKLDTRPTNAAYVTVVSKTDYEVQKEAIKHALIELGYDQAPAVQIDDTLIGGYVAEANSTRIDRSYKSALVSLYRSLTT